MLRALLSLFLLILSTGPEMAAQHRYPVEPIRPASVAEPPGAEDVRSLAESTRSSPPDLLTTEEKSNYTETGPYSEAVALARLMEKRSRFAKVVPIGRTPEGREMLVLMASKDRAFTPELVGKSGKPLVFVQNAIHSGEIAGKGATLMLMRDLLVSGRHAALLDHIHVAMLLVFNIDGHEMASPYLRINQNGPVSMGFRATAQRLNLNRDYVKADAPEMQAWLRYYNAWLPHLLIDHHVTNGMDFQYDLTIDMPENDDVALPLARWTRHQFLPSLYQRMDADGHVMGPYGYFDPSHPERGFRTQIFTPRFSQAYAAARNRAGLLIETHSLKSFRTRVWSHYDVTLHALQVIAAEPAALVNAVKLSDQATVGLGGSDAMLFLEGKHSAQSEDYLFRGVTAEQKPAPIAGGSVAHYTLPRTEIATKLYRRQEAAEQVRVPEAWAVPAAWTEVAAKLALHGVPFERLASPREGRCERYRLADPQFASAPVEGRFPVVSVKSETMDFACVLPADTLLVSARHPSARIAAHLLEPASPDSLLRWGLMHTVFERKEYFSPYVMEPIAQRMASQHPALREEFERRVLEDVAFAGTPRQRLEWFYNRSPYAEPGYLEYPVLRIWFTTR
ncbi:MAG: M14 family metallopeptidase [Bryobacterales bacterium]|nr:M14 family metallopeptidase [Bryobacterales bacterium]